MGTVKRVFCEKRINWGFFNDHGTTWHCNAHLNNFVITEPQLDQWFAYPLDYDLAFFEEEFANLEAGS